MPQLPAASSAGRTRDAREPIKLLYHGNRVHLETFPETALAGLDDLAGDMPLELNLHYSISKIGRWRPAVKLKNLRLHHHEWDEPAVWNALRNSDIGLVPNLIPRERRWTMTNWAEYSRIRSLNKFGKRADDYQLRFKVTSNAGRIYPFGYYGVPVVADYYPSSASLIRDGLDGYLVLHPLQWADRVRALAEDSVKRASLGSNLRIRIHEVMDPQKTMSAVTHELEQRFSL